MSEVVQRGLDLLRTFFRGLGVPAYIFCKQGFIDTHAAGHLADVDFRELGESHCDPVVRRFRRLIKKALET